MATKILPFVVGNDGKGLDFVIRDADYEKLDDYIKFSQPFLAIAMGSRHKTKQIPLDKLVDICKKVNFPVVLLGSNGDMDAADYICERTEKVVSLCGKLSLRESAACIERAKVLLTGDTGLMHIAAALNKPIVSVWGNTVPAFGMYPYMPLFPNRYHIVQNDNLSCRPCSKLGFEQCPKKHFKCMNDIDVNRIIPLLNE
jgi:heptosyltransferase-2